MADCLHNSSRSAENLPITWAPREASWLWEGQLGQLALPPSETDSSTSVEGRGLTRSDQRRGKTLSHTFLIIIFKSLFSNRERSWRERFPFYFLIKCHLLSVKELTVSCSA